MRLPSLKKQALELGIEIPSKEGWWWDDSEELINEGMGLQELEYAISHYLTEQGKAGVRKLIREEHKKEDEWRRARISWKFGLVVSIISAITGLAGAAIGILAFLTK